MEVWWKGSIPGSLKILCLDWAESLSGHAAAPSHPITRTFFGCEGECKVVQRQYVLQQLVLVEHVWAQCQCVHFGCVSLYSHRACVYTNTETHMYACTHVYKLIQETGVLCGCYGNWGLPLLPPPHLSNPPLPFLTLCNLLIWKQALVTQEPGTVTGSGTNPAAGADGRLGAAVRANRLLETELSWDEERALVTCTRHLSPSLCPRPPPTGSCRSGRCVPTSQALIRIICAQGAHINNALGSTDTCTQHPQGTLSPKWGQWSKIHVRVHAWTVHAWVHWCCIILFWKMCRRVMVPLVNSRK